MQDIGSFIQHHLLLSLGFLVALALLILLEYVKFKRGASRLTPTQATQLMNRDKGVVVDIRSPEAFSSGHIVNAISLPQAELSTKLKKIERFKSQPIIVVCAQGGADSLRAAASLAERGYQAQILAGGIRAWRDAGMPIVKG